MTWQSCPPIFSCVQRTGVSFCGLACLEAATDEMAHRPCPDRQRPCDIKFPQMSKRAANLLHINLFKSLASSETTIIYFLPVSLLQTKLMKRRKSREGEEDRQKNWILRLGSRCREWWHRGNVNGNAKRKCQREHRKMDKVEKTCETERRKVKWISSNRIFSDSWHMFRHLMSFVSWASPAQLSQSKNVKRLVDHAILSFDSLDCRLSDLASYLTDSRQISFQVSLVLPRPLPRKLIIRCLNPLSMMSNRWH
jgi:hypothetical protein